MSDLPAFDAPFHQGVRLMLAGDRAGAQAAFRATLALAPQLVAAQINLGLLLREDGCLDEAEHHYRAALAVDPGHYQAHLHLGVLLAASKRFAEAEHAYRQALAIDPEAPAAWSNLGVLLACLQREVEAETCYATALALAPDYRNARFNLAYLMLRQGRFAEGWAAFEARDWYARLASHFAFPRWQGEALHGKRLMIGFEAGHGDMIQFCRYASVAKTLGAAHITIVCHPGLKTLFTRLAGVDTVFGFDEDVARTGWDYWTAPLSFPLLCGTLIDTIPARLPYLAADPVKAARLAPLLDGALRVGLAWQGNPRFENDADRSLASLAILAPLFDIGGVNFFSLQKDSVETHPALTSLAQHIGDFDDTAALIANLDLVIAVDTAVAHLAGAMGKPCWLLLPDYRTDWRWLTQRTDSPWYPGMRLFRQARGGAWPAVIDEVKAALQLLPKARG
ncbi:tetratricopeptide repeat protein [Massilia sp. S19_KUP03_FR1]|uniref:tetratricopeptide repeat protein n=1 Tax=Massilia sp. S19_KUP03_FR1 TaxID=3025503 RepID=UPI002FCDE0CB